MSQHTESDETAGKRGRHWHRPGCSLQPLQNWLTEQRRCITADPFNTNTFFFVNSIIFCCKITSSAGDFSLGLNRNTPLKAASASLAGLLYSV